MRYANRSFPRIALDQDVKDAQAAAKTLQNALLDEKASRRRIRETVDTLCMAWRVPAPGSTEADSGDDIVDRLCYLSSSMSEQVRDALHTGVKRAMAVVRSGYVFDMEAVSQGFVSDPNKTAEENRAAFEGFIAEAEGPGERLARLFEPEVMPEETALDAEEDDGGDGDDEA